MAKGITLTPEEQLERRCEIKTTALELFAEKGFRKTSMREISEALGMGKSSLYDFFASKDEIVVFAFEQAMSEVIERAENISLSDLSPDEVLRKIMRSNLSYIKENKHLIGWLNAEASYLEEPYKERLHDVRHKYQSIIQGVIDKGISLELFRETQSLLATRLLINTMLSIAYTSRPTGTLEEMLEEAINIFLYGVTNTNK